MDMHYLYKYLKSRLSEKNAIVRDDADLHPVQLRKASHQRGGVLLLEFLKLRSIDQTSDDL